MTKARRDAPCTAANAPVFTASWCSSLRADTEVSLAVLAARGALYLAPLAQLIQ